MMPPEPIRTSVSNALRTMGIYWIIFAITGRCGDSLVCRLLDVGRHRCHASKRPRLLPGGTPSSRSRRQEEPDCPSPSRRGESCRRRRCACCPLHLGRHSVVDHLEVDGRPGVAESATPVLDSLVSGRTGTNQRRVPRARGGRRPPCVESRSCGCASRLCAPFSFVTKSVLESDRSPQLGGHPSRRRRKFATPPRCETDVWTGHAPSYVACAT